MKDEEIIFTTKEKLDEYNTKLLLRFVEYLNNQHKKNHSVFHCGSSRRKVNAIHLSIKEPIIFIK